MQNVEAKEHGTANALHAHTVHGDNFLCYASWQQLVLTDSMAASPGWVRQPSRCLTVCVTVMLPGRHMAMPLERMSEDDNLRRDEFDDVF